MPISKFEIAGAGVSEHPKFVDVEVWKNVIVTYCNFSLISNVC